MMRASGSFAVDLMSIKSYNNSYYLLSLISLSSVATLLHCYEGGLGEGKGWEEGGGGICPKCPMLDPPMQCVHKIVPFMLL